MTVAREPGSAMPSLDELQRIEAQRRIAAAAQVQLQALLGFERAARAHELARATAACPQPRWVLVATMAAVLATSGLAWFARGHVNTAAAAHEAGVHRHWVVHPGACAGGPCAPVAPR